MERRRRHRGAVVGLPHRSPAGQGAIRHLATRTPEHRPTSRGYSASQPAPSCQEPLIHSPVYSLPVRAPLGRMIQRRGHLGLPGQGDRPGHDRWRCGDRGLVVAALDGVLQLERELRRQPSKVDSCLAAPLAVPDELLAFGPPWFSNPAVPPGSKPCGGVSNPKPILP